MLIERGPAGAMKVLIVDDEPSILESLADLLRREFYIYATDDVDQALGLLQFEDIALILTDQRMPKLNGTELLARATEINPQCVRMLLTAYSDVEAVIQAINQGRVYYYLSKPWDPVRLPELIRDATQQYALAAENDRLIKQLAEITRRAETAQVRVSEMVGEQAQQRQANQTLQNALDQLQSSYSQAEAANAAKDEFLAMLAHELRNPLAPIRNAVQVMRMAGSTEPIMQRQQGIIDRQVTHMARLLDDLLDVSRITRGNINLKQEAVSLSDVFARAVETANPQIESRRHTLVVTPPWERMAGLGVVGDFDRLIQIVGNLLTNAAKYTGEGGTIWLEAVRDGEEAVIRVRDTGVGIAPEMLPRIFEIFTQAERSLDRSQGGLGLGLTLVRKLVRLHGGTVEAHSAGLGQGSEFTVRLPALPETQEPDWPEAGAQAQAETIPRRRILVVDDVADTANSLAELLSLLGHELRTAYEGHGALLIAREFRPEVILLDIGLPGMSGFEVTHQLRCDPEMAGVIVVAMTGYGQEEDRRQAEQASFDHYFTKPVDLNVLQTVLARP